MKRSFANLADKLKTADASASPFGGAATEAGSARVPARVSHLPASDKIDHAFPTVTGTVIAAKNHPRVPGLMCIEMLATSAAAPESAAAGVNLVFDLPSGTFTPATTKVTTIDPKLKLTPKPHRLADKFALLPLTGVLSFTVTTKGQGSMGGDLSVADLPIGREIEAMRFSYEMKLGENGEYNVFAGADTISFTRNPPFITEAQQAVVDKAFNSPAVHREVVLNVARAAGEHQIEPLFEFMKLDAAAVKTKIEQLKGALAGNRVGAGLSLECAAISADTEASMDSVVEVCEATSKLEDPSAMPANAVCDVIDLVARSSKVDISRCRIAPFLQSAVDPHTKKLLGCDLNGVGPKTFEFADARNEKLAWTKDFNFFSEALFRSTKTATDKSVGSFEADVQAIAICVKNPTTGEWTDLVPQLDSGASMCLAQALFSAKVFVAPRMQIFDYKRLPVLTNAILPYSAMLVVLPQLPTRINKCTDVQPLIAGDFGGVYPHDNVVDFGSGIVSCGVKVSAAFIGSNFCDESGDFFVVSVPDLYAYSSKVDAGVPAEPTKTRFEVEGRACLNAFAETRVSKFTSTKILPTGAGGVDFYALYPGVASDVANDQTINSDTAAGDAALKAVMEKEKDIAEWQTGKLAIYAVAVAKEGSEKTETPAAKKQKVEDTVDSD